jgi:hypothetical protein
MKIGPVAVDQWHLAILLLTIRDLFFILPADLVEEFMRKLLGVLAVLVVGVGLSLAQFKSQPADEPRISEGMVTEGSSSLFFGWFNPENFRMRHSVSMSYSAAGSYGFSLATYTNSMTYQFSDRLNARADVSMSYSPFNSLPGNMGADLSKIYLSRAELNYRPWDNFNVYVQYRQLPYGGYYGSPFYDPFSTGFGF